MIKKCKQCGKEFTAFNTIQNKCYECQALYGYNLKPKKNKPIIRKPIVKRKKNIQNKLLDTLWSKAVKILDNNKCVHCGSSEHLNSHHIIGRRNFAVRWEVINGVTLCPKCHVYSSKFSAHQTPTIFTDWIKEKKGLDWYDELIELSNTIKPNKERLLVELKEICYGKEKLLPF
jgi:hypothetical protein